MKYRLKHQARVKARLWKFQVLAVFRLRSMQPSSTPNHKRAVILWNHRWEYDKNPESFFKLLFKLADQNIDFNWGSGSPDGVITNDDFSVRWTGQVQAAHSESYTFYARVDDGVRLWVDGQLIILKEHLHILKL